MDTYYYLILARIFSAAWNRERESRIDTKITLNDLDMDPLPSSCVFLFEVLK